MHNGTTYPAFILFVFLAAGLLAGGAGFLPAALTGLAICAFLFYAYRFQFLAPAQALIHFAASVTGFTLSFLLSIPPAHDLQHLPDGIYHCSAKVDAPPRPKEKSVQLQLSDISVFNDDQSFQSSGKMMIYIPLQMDSIPAQGEQISFTARLQAPDSELPEGYLKYLESKKIRKTAWVSEFRKNSSGNSLFEWRRYLSGAVTSHMTDPEAIAVSRAMLLGDRSGMTGAMRSTFSEAGVSHVMAISGMHLGIFYLILNVFTGALRRRKKLRVLRYPLMITGLWLFAMITGASPSVMRAALMFSLLLTGRMIDRPYVGLNILGFAGMTMLTFNPFQIHDIGFQLSFAAVSGIMIFQPRLSGLLNEKASFIPEAIRNPVALTLSAQVFTTPLVLLHFGQFPVWFIPANLLIVPLASVSVISGFLFLCFSWIPGLSLLLAFFTEQFTWALIRLTELIAALPFSTFGLGHPENILPLVIQAVAIFLVLYRTNIRTYISKLNKGIALQSLLSNLRN